jgi:hypothetical protein
MKRRGKPPFLLCLLLVGFGAKRNRYGKIPISVPLSLRPLSRGGHDCLNGQSNYGQHNAKRHADNGQPRPRGLKSAIDYAGK